MLEVQNQTFMLKQIWSIFARFGFLWVSWIKENFLKQKSFWSVGIPQNYSWCWRKILKLRDIAKKILRFEVGEGKTIHLWVDCQHLDGILLDRYDYRAIYDAQINVEAKLSSVIHNRDWFQRPARSEVLVEIQAKLSEINLGSIDKPSWTTIKNGYYVSSDTWEVLRVKREQVEWWKLVWFPLAIPKQAFILWLVMKEMLVQKIGC